MNKPTQGDVMEKCEELAEKMREEILSECLRYLRSGAIDLQDFEDNYRLPKVMVTAAAKNCGYLFRPLSNESDLLETLEKV